MKKILSICTFLPVLMQVAYGGIRIDGPPGRVHVVSIGIDKYPSITESLFDLSFCQTDAKSIADSVTAMARRGSGEVYESVLLGESARLSNIQDTLEAVIQRARPNDVFVFYYAGGSFIEKPADLYLLPYDASKGPLDSSVTNTIPANLLKTWFARIPARNQLIVLDAGPSSFNAFSSLYGEDQLIRSGGDGIARKSRRGRNVVMISSYPYGMPDPEKKHGVLTESLLQGLTGKASSARGLISAWGLETYASRQLYERGDSLPYKVRVASYIEGTDFFLGQAGGVRKSTGSLQSRGVQVLDQEMQEPAEISHGPKNYALLFATNAYDNFKGLTNPISDARTIASELKESYGFETAVFENLSRDSMEIQIQNFMERKFSDEDQLLIFIAGHGEYQERGKQGYIVARDSKTASVDPLRRTCLKHTDLNDDIDNIECKHILLVLDVCFGGTFDRRIANAKNRGEDDVYREITDLSYIARKRQIKTRWYLTSGGKEYVPDGRPNRHSPFAFKIIETLREYSDRKKMLTTATLKTSVEKLTPEPCMGEFGSYEPKGDFILVPR
jgi:uncharacterized caspase-like protein